MRKSLKKLISEKLIENNPVIVEEMRKHNAIYGHIEDKVRRMKYVASLYWNYSVLKRNPYEIKIKENRKAIYPESASDSIEKTISKMKTQIDLGDNVIFDVWDLLLYQSITEKYVYALLEIQTGDLGIITEIKRNTTINQRQREILETIEIDFSLDCKIMHSMFEYAQNKGKKVYLYNESKLISDDTCKKILNRYGYYNFELVEDINENGGIYFSKEEWGNICLKNNIYRPYSNLTFIPQLYNTIVNLRMHGNVRKFSIFYEYGFNYGGILTCGFCQFLNGIAKKNGIDKFLFVARDGYIIQKVYNAYFNEIENEYLLYSRFASYELIYEEFPNEYIEKNVKPRIYRKNHDNSVKKILRELGLTILLDYLKETELNECDVITEKNFIYLQQLLLNNYSLIKQQFQEAHIAASQYIMELVGNAKNICIVDLGWHGTSTIYLQKFIKKYIPEVKIMGAMIGALDNDITQMYIMKGTLETYAFSNDRCRDSLKSIPMTYEELLVHELLFSAPTETLLHYGIDKKGRQKFTYGLKNENYQIIKDIHQGIQDFARQIIPILNKYNLKINSTDAYAPLYQITQNKAYVEVLLKAYYETDGAINGYEN